MRIVPALGYFDLRFDAGMFGEQVEQIAAAQQFKRLSLGELIGGFAIAAGGDENAFGGALVLDCAV